MILQFELLEPLPAVHAMHERVPAVVVEMLASGLPPKEVLVKNQLLGFLLQPVAQDLGFNIKKRTFLPAVDRMHREIESHSERRHI